MPKGKRDLEQNPIRETFTTPIPPAGLPEEIIARVNTIEVADDKKSKVSVKEMKLCEKGTEIHYHFR